jgi:hypothetical protein
VTTSPASLLTPPRRTEIRRTEIRHTEIRHTEIRHTEIRHTEIRHTEIRRTGPRRTGHRTATRPARAGMFPDLPRILSHGGIRTRGTPGTRTDCPGIT